MSDPGSGRVELIVPFPPAGVSDRVARCLADALARHGSIEVDVRNLAGGGGTAGMLALLAAAPDGATAMMAATGQVTQNPAIDPALPYRWDSARPVGRLSRSALAVVVRGDSPITDLEALLARIRAAPESSRIGTSGNGGASLLAVARLLHSAGIDPCRLQRTPYPGGVAILDAVLEGRSDFAAQYVAEMGEWLAGGELRALAVSGSSRVDALAQVPSALECGHPSFDLVGWTGVMLPPRTDPEVVARWVEALRAVRADPSFVAAVTSLGAEVDDPHPERFREELAREYAVARDTAVRLGLAR